MYSNRLGKDTYKAVARLQGYMCSVGPEGWFLQLDIRNFFNSIDKPILFGLLQQRLRKAVKQRQLTPAEAETLRWLCHVLLKQDTSQGVRYRSQPKLLQLVPPHQRLGTLGVNKGLPIGNLTSQFFANVYLNPFDQFVKHTLKCRHYLRYVDDFILLAEQPEILRAWCVQIAQFLQASLQLTLKPAARQPEPSLPLPKPIKAGVDFLGYIVRPHYCLVRRRMVGNLREKLHAIQRQLLSGGVKQGYWVTFMPTLLANMQAILVSYSGHFQHASSGCLWQQLLADFPWLTLIGDSQPTASANRSYRQQQGFFQRRYPLAERLIQRGTQTDRLHSTALA